MPSHEKLPSRLLNECIIYALTWRFRCSVKIFFIFVKCYNKIYTVVYWLDNQLIYF